MPRKPTGKPNGKPPFKPTAEDRKQVFDMSAVGIPQESICRVIRADDGGIDDKTLRKHFRKELDTAKIKADANVSGMLYNNCMAGKERSIEWWEKTRQNRREAATLEHSGSIGVELWGNKPE